MAAAHIVQPLPQLERADEFAALVIKLGVLLVGLGLLFQRPVTHILHAECRGNHQCLVERAAFLCLQQDAAHARVQRQAGQRLACACQLLVVIDRAQLIEQLVAIADRLGARCFQKREMLHLAQMQRLHAQDHAGQRRAQDFRIGKRLATGKILLVIQADADAVGNPAATAGTLVGCRLADRLHQQLLDLVAIAVALDARGTGIDHVADAWHRQRGFCHVGGQHDAAALVVVEHAVLLGLAQARKQRQHLGVAQHRAVAQVLAQMIGSFTDLALAGQEHQDVAAVLRAAPELVHGIGNRRIQIGIARLFKRTIADFHRKQPARYHQHRCRSVRRGKVLRKAVGINRGRGDNQFQVGPARQDFLQVAEQKVDVQAALVRLVNDQRVVGLEQRIALRFGQQNAVRHQLDRSALLQPVGKTHLVAHHLAQRRLQFFGDALGHAAGGNPAWLRVADQARPLARLGVAGTAPERQRDLGQLRGLAGAGFATNNDHLVALQRRHDLVATAGNRQRFRKLDTQGGFI